MKKLLTALAAISSASLLSVCAVACGDGNNSSGANDNGVKYAVAWYDESGNVLVTQQLKEGVTPAYTYDKQDTAEWDYTFEGWSLTAGGSVLQSLPSVSADAQYYAIVSKVKQKYTVTFSTGEGSAMPSVQKEYGETVAEPDEPTPPSGKSFEGWYTDSACNNVAVFPLTVNGNVTLYAKYEDIKHTVKWYNEDGGLLAEQELKEGVTPAYTYNKQDTAEWDFTVEGWSATTGGNVLQSLPALTADVEYYAVVSRVKQKYTVTFNTGEGSAIPSVQKEYGETLAKPDINPTPPEGNRFVGWCTDSTCQTSATFPMTITGNVTLYAAYHETVDVKALVSSLLAGYKLDPYSYVPEAMLPQYANNLVNASTVKKTEEDYASFVNKSQMPSKGFGEQWHMIADNLKQSQLFFNALSAVEDVITASVATFNNYIDSNPSDTAHHSFKHGDYDVTVDCSGGKVYYVLDYTGTFPLVGEQQAQIALSMVGGKRTVRIQLGNPNALAYTITDNGYTFALKMLGLRRSMFDVSRDESGKVTGHINEFLTASGVTDKAIASAADFYIDGNYVSAVGNKADGMVVFDGYISELYNANTGKLISYEVRETKSSLTFDTLWFDLADISGINSVKYVADGKKFYVNGSSTAWEAKKVGGLSLKTASRRFDIEFRTQYFYAADGEEVAVKVPMLFVQEDQFNTLPADVAEKNSGVSISVNVSTTNINKQKNDYATLVDAFIEHKADITVDYIIEYIGDAVEFN